MAETVNIIRFIYGILRNMVCIYNITHIYIHYVYFDRQDFGLDTIRLKQR